jgi:hypothetical protein
VFGDNELDNMVRIIDRKLHKILNIRERNIKLNI